VRKAIKILVGKPDAKRLLRRARPTREDNINITMDLGETRWEVVTGFI
jgi:hypothetical protein